jgi:hypothetical protein
MVPISLTIQNRVRIEEAVLLDARDPGCAEFRAGTKRLIRGLR